MESIEKYFAWLEQHCPDIASELHGSANSDRLDRLEEKVGFRLPEDVRGMLGMRAGQQKCSESCEECIGAIYGLYFLTPDEIAAEWDLWADFRSDYTPDELADQFDRHEEVFAPDVVAKAYSKPGWIPLFRCPGRHDYFGVDLQPGELGQYGQVINFGRDEPKKYAAAASLDQFFAKLLSWGAREIPSRTIGAHEQVMKLFDTDDGALLFNRFYDLAEGQEPALHIPGDHLS
ncbi:SMI1/KNR4 family protein [Streptomyces sp. NPDC052013]|uniref:SMI1/KNR4 family protein n=1 Tax=Streptomyces sp. NPDC052013 TaxID=3365679 RepID=UPI0037D6DF2A